MHRQKYPKIEVFDFWTTIVFTQPSVLLALAASFTAVVLGLYFGWWVLFSLRIPPIFPVGAVFAICLGPCIFFAILGRGNMALSFLMLWLASQTFITCFVLTARPFTSYWWLLLLGVVALVDAVYLATRPVNLPYQQ